MKVRGVATGSDFRSGLGVPVTLKLKTKERSDILFRHGIQNGSLTSDVPKVLFDACAYPQTPIEGARDVYDLIACAVSSEES